VAASGSGWDPDQQVSIFLDQAYSLDPSSALAVDSADRSGAFSASLVVPDQAGGDYTFYACQSCGDPDGFPAASMVFTIPTSSTTTGSPFKPRNLLLFAAVASLVVVVTASLLLRRRAKSRRVRSSPADPQPAYGGEVRYATTMELPDVELVRASAGDDHSVRLVPTKDIGTQQLEEV